MGDMDEAVAAARAVPPRYPVILYVGKEAGRLEVKAFSTEEHAAAWAAADCDNARYVWAVTRLLYGPPMRGRHVPASATLEPVGAPQDAPS